MMGSPHAPILRTSIQPVIVVPMLAPMITPKACMMFISPMFVNPTTITVVIELDWTMHVTSVPIPTAMNRLRVARLIIRRRRGPATNCTPSDMYFMPRRKMPSPPMACSSTLSSKLDVIDQSFSFDIQFQFFGIQDAVRRPCDRRIVSELSVWKGVGVASPACAMRAPRIKNVVEYCANRPRRTRCLSSGARIVSSHNPKSQHQGPGSQGSPVLEQVHGHGTCTPMLGATRPGPIKTSANRRISYECR